MHSCEPTIAAFVYGAFPGRAKRVGACEWWMNPKVSKDVLLEICVESLDYAVAAQGANAGRVELCSDLACGGITPSAGLMEAARDRLHVPVHVLIRPRPGDFFYSASEFDVMRKDIRNAKRLGMDGIVLGLLTRKLQVDVARTRELVELAHPLPVTFHRAFDQSRSWRDSLEAVIQAGVHRLLTSSCKGDAMEGLPILARLAREANDRIIVMPGGGITPTNVVRVVAATSAREIHASLRTPSLGKTNGVSETLQHSLYQRRVLKVTSLLRGETIA
jgi:copper homeostasis protein